MDINWLEVAIDTLPQGLEDVEAYLTAAGVGGLVIEDEDEFHSFMDENRDYWDYVDEKLEAEMKGVTRVKFYVTDDEDGHARLDGVLAGLEAFRARAPHDVGSLAVHQKTLREEDWANNWKQYYKPFPVGEKLYIVPEWERGLPVPDGRTAVYLNPGLIFGTGSHGTTQLCLAGVEQYVRPGDSVLDLGCGSGILGIAALRLGAKSVKGCDIDAKAVKVAEENASFNGIGPELKVYAGNVLSDQKLKDALAGSYELVLANIVADVIIPLTAQVGDYLAPDGVFLCSGIIGPRAEEVAAALAANGFAILHRWERDGWVAYAAKKNA